MEGVLGVHVFGDPPYGAQVNLVRISGGAGGANREHLQVQLASRMLWSIQARWKVSTKGCMSWGEGACRHISSTVLKMLGRE